MKGVINGNTDIKYLKEEFKTFVEQKQLKETTNPKNTKETNTEEKLILEEVEL